MLLVAVLVGLNTILYVAMLLRGGLDEIGRFSPSTLLRFGALHTPLVRRGEVWRLVTAMFLHVSPAHLVTNMVTLVCAGILAIPRYGRARVALIYLIAGLAGSALSLAWRWGRRDDDEGQRDEDDSPDLVTQGFSLTRVVRGWRRSSISAGASAAICGLIAASAMRARMTGESDGSELIWGAALWAGCMLLDGTVGASDNAAHVGGLVAGVLAGVLMRGEPERWMYSGAIGHETIALVALVVAGVCLAARSNDPRFHPTTLVREGDVIFASGRSREALSRYQRALWLSPRYAVAHLRVAQVCWRERDIGGALDAATIASECDPELDEAHALVRSVRSAIDARV